MAALALIFDLDGTVWDSAGWFAAGLAGGDEAKRDAFRDALVEGGNIIALLSRAGLSRQRMLSEAKRRAGPPPLFDGMKEVIQALNARGTPLAIATSLPGTIALPMLKEAGIANAFAAVVHAGVCRASKPSPAPINMAMSAIGVQPSLRIFYVGDRRVDAEAAARAGVSSAWVGHGYEAPPSGVARITAAELVDL